MPKVDIDEHSCDVEVTVPLQIDDSHDKLQAQCNGAESVKIEALIGGSTQWRTIPARSLGGARLSLVGLQPESVYRFRARAHNRHGDSPPSLLTPPNGLPIVPGLPQSLIQTPPSVQATSSASFLVMLPGAPAPCQASLSWHIFLLIEKIDLLLPLILYSKDSSANAFFMIS